MSPAFGQEVRTGDMILRSHQTVFMTMELDDITHTVSMKEKRSKTEVTNIERSR